MPLPRICRHEDIAVLPGGSIALRGPDGILVCDPVEAIAYDEPDSRRLRRRLQGRAEVTTLCHSGDGIHLHARIPRQLPPQSVTIVPYPDRVSGRLPFRGPILIQWGMRGAVAWPLVEAPAHFALAASIAASPVTDERPLIFGRSGRHWNGGCITPATLCACENADRFNLIAEALIEYISDLSALRTNDHRWLELLDVYVDGPASLARRIADGLSMLPGFFFADPNALPGAPPAVWRIAIGHIMASPRPLALLGLENVVAPMATIRVLRGLVDKADLFAFRDDGSIVTDGPVDLHGHAAQILGRKAGEHGRLALTLSVPAQPVDFYALAHDAAVLTGDRTTALAPCWGFCHRIGSDGDEAGNAAWFGMGAGLDEVDFLPSPNQPIA